MHSLATTTPQRSLADGHQPPVPAQNKLMDAKQWTTPHVAVRGDERVAVTVVDIVTHRGEHFGPRFAVCGVCVCG